MFSALLPILLLNPATPSAQEGSDASPPTKDIVATAAGAPEFSGLVKALEEAGLVDELRKRGPFTVFAPTNAAFNALPAGALAGLLRPESRDELRAVLLHHVVAGEIRSLDALKAGEATTLQGDKVAIELSGGQLKVGAARVIQNDIATTNGVIHAIDAVLLPPAPPEPERTPLQARAELIEIAIERGVPLFNAGERAACAAIYEVACRALLDLDNGELSERSLRAIKGALRRAASEEDDGDKAWALRRGIAVARRELSEHRAKAREAS